MWLLKCSFQGLTINSVLPDIMDEMELFSFTYMILHVSSYVFTVTLLSRQNTTLLFGQKWALSTILNVILAILLKTQTPSDPAGVLKILILKQESRQVCMQLYCQEDKSRGPQCNCYFHYSVFSTYCYHDTPSLLIGKLAFQSTINLAEEELLMLPFHVWSDMSTICRSKSGFLACWAVEFPL